MPTPVHDATLALKFEPEKSAHALERVRESVESNNNIYNLYSAEIWQSHSWAPNTCRSIDVHIMDSVSNDTISSMQVSGLGIVIYIF